MAKIITKLGACSVKNKPMGVQIRYDGSTYALGGTYSVSGDEAVVSPDEINGNVTLDPGFASRGCKLCGNKFMFRCGACGRFICYDGRAKRGFKCPACGRTADVPAASGNSVPTTNARPIRGGGGTVHLRQGDSTPITLPSGEPMTRITVGVGWDPVAYDDGNMDVDSSVVVAGNGGYDTIYFANKLHPTGCVIHHGDNVTGDGSGDDENIDVYLDKVPNNRDRLYFTLNIFSGQLMQDVRNLYIRLCDPDSGETLVDYKVTGNYYGYRSIVIGVAYRDGGDWSFKAIGQGSYQQYMAGLAEEAIRIRP